MKYGISLNPKKSIFGVDKRKILGHIVSEKGISIDLKWIQSIKDVQPTTNKKSLQSFFGKINFIRQFILITERIKSIYALLKKITNFIWNDNSLRYFEDIKYEITKELVLVIHDYSCDFIIFSFSSRDTIVGVLLPRNVDDHEQPINFMRKYLRESYLNHSITDK
jgi:hypothetical protein